MNDNYMKTILSGVKEWTENLTDDAIDKANNALDKALFVVNITSSDGRTFSADKTFEEIISVYNEGKYNIVAHIMGVYIMPPLSIISNHAVVFGAALNEGGHDVVSVIIAIAPDNSIQMIQTPLATTTSKLPNPYPLTFTGAVNETYDGSSAKTIEIPSGGGGGGIGDFELIGTVDFSQENLATAGGGVTFEVTDVSEILLISNDLVNSTSSNSTVFVYLNKSSGQVESMLRPDSGKSGTPLNGWVFIKHLSGVGLTGIQSSSAISSTNYNVGAAKIPYNIRPLASDFKITDISIQNPPTQYYAVGGTVKVYVR